MSTDSVDPRTATVPGGVRRALIELYSHDGCPMIEEARALLQRCLEHTELPAEVVERVGDYPSPTLVINGRDVATGGPPPSPGPPACRTDLPTSEQLIAVLSAHTPRHPGEDTNAEISEVLFVCVHNAGRSQMAAALLDHHAHGAVQVRSAGSTPAAEISPAVHEVMAELGLDLSREFPKPLTTDVVAGADVVITMGCGDACPVFPGKRYLDWTLPDPAGLPAEQVRPIRDDIDTRVRALLAELVTVPLDQPSRR